MKSYPTAQVLFSDSESDANLYYATRFLVPDPVLFLQINRRKILILNDLEVDRGKSEAEVDEVLSLTELTERVKKKLGKKPAQADLLLAVLQDRKIRQVEIPHQFPAYLAFELQKRGIKLSFRPDPFWKERLLKSEAEKNAIRDSLKATGQAIRQAYRLLEQTKIVKKSLVYQGKVLTSERLRQCIDLYLMEKGYLPRNTIVAGGDQAVDPHNRGSGPLHAHQAIVMDVFPKSMKTQYYADMTRTVVKGKPSPELKKIWQAVKDAQEWAIDQIKAGVNGKTIHEGILRRFEAKGYKSGIIDGRMQGFFHGTGHGLGLDIHEAPRISKIDETLQAGMVVTVEPGLYYAGIGGVRIEDVVHVTREGCEVLSSCPKKVSID